MTSLTGLASSSITSMIPGLCAAGQMKLVGATSAQGKGGANDSNLAVNPASITIPALTGSQIAIIYLEVYGSIDFVGSSYTNGYRINASASGTGVNLSVVVSGVEAVVQNSTSSASLNTQFKNSAFGTTTTGGQTISFAGTVNGGAIAPNGLIQAAVFIYSPPF